MTVYCSSLLPKKSPETYQGIRNALNDIGIEFELIQNTKDVWCRDYMPVVGANGSMVQFSYKPSYLTKGERTLPECYRNQPFASDVIFSGIVLDGGTIEICNDIGMVTSRIEADNPGWSRSGLISELKELLSLQHLFVLPEEPDDDLGHIDGMARLVSREHVLINDYSRIGELASFGKNLEDRLIGEGFKVSKMPYAPADEKGPEGIWPATGVYTNYLRIEKTILLPTYGLDSDAQACQVSKELFPACNIVHVDCARIAVLGGAIHCVTWNISSDNKVG